MSQSNPKQADQQVAATLPRAAWRRAGHSSTWFSSSRRRSDLTRRRIRIPGWSFNLYQDLTEDDDRNRRICHDIVESVREGRSPLVLTERNDHLDCLEQELAAHIAHVVVLRAGMGKKQRQVVNDRLAAIPRDEGRVILATGRYVGEGFDDPRLDTLFLTLPVSWRGTVAQYAGRLHRLYDGKREVRIYDYADLNVPMLARMFDRRCRGYETIGYSVLLPASAIPGWPADVLLPSDPAWKRDYSGSVRRLAGDLPHIDKRLLEIARALALRPGVLMLDEPAAGLNHADKLVLAKLLRRIADAGLAVVLIEHDMSLVMGISDRIVVLDAGKRLAHGRPEAIRNDPAVIDAYLGGAKCDARPRAPGWQPARDAILAAKRLTAGYGAASVVKGVELQLDSGELVAVLGANGAGKSTLMRALSGLLRPVDGSILFVGKEINQFAAHRIAGQGLVLVPEGRQVFPELPVIDNIRLGAYARTDFDPSEVDALLARFPSIERRKRNRAGLLSGGEQQMLAIARGLIAKPRVLLLDEPSLGLAPALVNELFHVLAELRDQGMTILLVDQMAALALSVADRGYVMESGAIVHAGVASELRNDPALERAYLGQA